MTAEPEPSDWDVLWSVLVVWGCLWAITIGIVAVIVTVKLLSGDRTPPTPAEMMTPTVIAVTSGADFAVAVAATWFFTAFRHRRRFRDALAIRTVPRRTLAIAILVGIATPIGSFLLPQGEVSPIEVLSSTLPGLVVLSLLALTSPFVEEIWYRGMFLPVARRWLGPIPAIALVAAWFGGMHYFQLRGNGGAALYITGLGVVWTTQRHLTGSLVPGIVSHFLHNAAVIALSWVALATAGGS